MAVSNPLEDFMFQLSNEKFMNLMYRSGTSNLKSQIVTSSWSGLHCATPYAITEQGVAAQLGSTIATNLKEFEYGG